jgi:DNA-binding transcriptional LysR family regulator
MFDRLKALKLFVRVAKTGSFSSAGREVGMSQPSASRHVALLELDLGTTLVNRTTRSVSLTEAGKQYLERVEAILAQLAEADYEARGSGELRGTLRVGLSSSFANRAVIPALGAFRERHAKLEVQLFVSDTPNVFAGGSLDVVLRQGEPANSSAIARLILACPRVLVASQSYILNTGPIAAPADLRSHTVIVGSLEMSPSLRLSRGGESALIQPRKRLVINNTEGAVAAAVEGLGVAQSCVGGSRREVDSGALVRVLAEWEFGVVPTYALYSRSQKNNPAVRAFVDFLTSALRNR